MEFLLGDGGAVVFILFAGFGLGAVFGWSLLEGHRSGGGGGGQEVVIRRRPGRPVAEPREAPVEVLADVIPLRPTGTAERAVQRARSSAETPSTR